MRSLWTAATGMKAQQFNIDTIANNLSNVNTVSYKKQRAEFKDLLYTTLNRGTRVDEEGRPVNLEIGHGVKPSATGKNFKDGSLIPTENPLDVAIHGSGFFVVQLPNGEYRYTRDGSFKLSVEGNQNTLVTSDGYTVLNQNNNPIRFNGNVEDITIDQFGNISIEYPNGTGYNIGRLRLVNFANPEGLLSEGKNLYSMTDASGGEVPIYANEMDGEIVQGHLEASNVQVVDEMVEMITAQRAYEINSKTIQTSDEMLQMINNLKR